MSLSKTDLRDLADCALHAAEEASRLVAGASPTTIEAKPGTSDASRVVTDVDHMSEALILEALAPTMSRFDLGLVSEERGDDGSRLRCDYFWSVDPLDGTLPFSEGKPGYAVSIALVSKQGRSELGVIADPVRGKIDCAIRGLGISRNGKPWQPQLGPGATTLSVFADRSLQARADFAQIQTALAETAASMGLKGSQIHIGSGAVVNACQVLENAPACYFKFPKKTPGGGSIWDVAATSCLFAEAGGIATDMGGGRLDLNRADATDMNHRGILFATDEELARRVRDLQLP